ncbi:hypothetical protein Agub_g3795 [Astrephomene gubernaculifera]|uniref:Uncharacterized protein n=1 Tax=Astrephomene gubernaculifera TaxID=47775 RepID=A0AAD3DLV6_9CHLO|nr:hypothetical protein Agub_g3795 [Astrephomene gubernaculifera]
MVALTHSSLGRRALDASCYGRRSPHICVLRVHHKQNGVASLGRQGRHLQHPHRTIFRVSAAVVGDQGDSHAQQTSISGPLGSALQFASALQQFSRPHTMIGTALSVVSISLLALGGAQISAPAITAVLQALVSALLMNIAIVGINQLYDIEIDKVNKPYLPLASGALTPVQGAVIVAVCAVVATAIGVASGSPALLTTLLVSLALGVLYSANLPFMRWKRSPFLAAGCILAVRAVIVQLGFYSHMKGALLAAGTLTTTPVVTTAAASSSFLSSLLSSCSYLLRQLQLTTASLSPAVQFVMGFMLFFSVVIALFKDLPDVAGDRKAGVRTLSVRLGEGAVFRLCVQLLSCCYGWAMLAALSLPGLAAGGAARAALFGGHAVLCGLLLARARSVDVGSPAALTSYYMFVWKLFYAEYLLIPLFG